MKQYIPIVLAFLGLVIVDFILLVIGIGIATYIVKLVISQ
jgi:hypothetical protein